jgi:PleD family two-component response regulator
MRDGEYANRSADILIVDDAPENLDILIEILRHSSYHLHPVTNARAALQAARKTPPDLILLDVHMPEMDGLTLCGELLKMEDLKNTPVIFISGQSGPDEIKKTFAAGGADYIVKPFRSEEVLARVGAQLELRFLKLDLERYKNKYGALQ